MIYLFYFLGGGLGGLEETWPVAFLNASYENISVFEVLQNDSSGHLTQILTTAESFSTQNHE